MKRLALLMTLLIPVFLISQPCLPEGITFTTQEQIDNFQTDYPGCTEIEGGVEIDGDDSDIKNLNGLNVLTSIGGDLRIFETFLINMDGLNNLTSVQGGVSIGRHKYIGNPQLQSLSGLDNLSYVGGDLGIMGNQELYSLEGLGSLTSIGGTFRIANRGIKSLNGIDSLNEVGENLIIGYDYSLKVNGGESVLACGGITDIENLNGLSNLTSADGIYLFCTALTSLSGLESLESLSVIWLGGEGLRNEYLTDISALSNLNPDLITDVIIIENESLSNCEINSICAVLDSLDVNITINNNATGCNSIEEVEDACETVTINEGSISTNLVAHPNPFTSSTTIKYSLANPQTVTITFFNQFGKQVDKIESWQQKGLNNIIWTPKNLADGIYYFRLEAGKKVISGKVIFHN